jgi:LPXTG-motif cell wall-anchored protein
MSRRSLLRRLVIPAVAAVLSTGGLLLGTAAPASADPPVLSFADLCGAAELSWDAGPVIGGEPVATTVLRNGAVLEDFAMGNRGRQRYAAADGDTFVVRRAGLPDTTFRHDAPDDCAGAPRLAVSVTDECFSAMLRLDNSGTTAVDGLRLHTSDTPAGRALPPVEPGVTEVPVAVADGDFYRLTSGSAGADAALWLQGSYDRPAGCGPDAVAVTATDGCRGTRLKLVNRAEGVVRVEVVAGASEVPYARALAAGASDTVELPAAPGTTLVVRDSVTGVRFAEHTTGPVPCTSPGGDPSGTPGAPDGGEAGGLPVTGAGATGYATAGLLLAVAGLGLAVLARRRRTRFTAGD